MIINPVIILITIIDTGINSSNIIFIIIYHLPSITYHIS